MVSFDIKFISITIILNIFNLNCCVCSNTTLQLLHVFFRHGSRTPSAHELYPNDPYKEELYNSYGYGELTNAGKQKSYRLGKVLKEKYKYFLGATFENGFVETYTTDVSRTKATALLVLAGLYPPTINELWEKEILWQPIPYNYIINEKDYWLRRPLKFCPNYLQERQKAIEKNQNVLKAHQYELEYISNNTGKVYSTYNDVLRLYQLLNAEEHMKLDLPKWSRQIHPSLTYKLASKLLYIENSDTITLRRLTGGRTMKMMLEHIKKKVNDTLTPANRKIYLYSGHDSTVVGILSAMNLFEEHFPKYASAVIIELHKFPETDHYLKVQYLRDVEEPFEELTIETCDLMCPLDHFIQIVEPYIPQNYTDECGANVNLDELEI